MYYLFISLIFIKPSLAHETLSMSCLSTQSAILGHNREEVISLSYALAFTTLKKSGVPPEEQRDIAQEVAIAVFRSLGTYDRSKSEMKTWIINIARNKIIDHWRKIKRSPAIEIRNPTEMVKKERMGKEDLDTLKELEDNSITFVKSISDIHLRTLYAEYLSGQYKEEDLILRHSTNKSSLHSKIRMLKEQNINYLVERDIIPRVNDIKLINLKDLPNIREKLMQQGLLPN